MLKFLKYFITRFKKKSLTDIALAEYKADNNGLFPQRAPSSLEAINSAVQWLCCAQDNSTSADGGVARHFCLIKGWSSSYPETTGYIIPTFIELANRSGNEDLHRRAKRMLDWCVSIQFREHPIVMHII